MTRVQERPPPFSPSLRRRSRRSVDPGGPARAVEAARTRLLRYGAPTAGRSLGYGAETSSPEDVRRASLSLPPDPRPAETTVDGLLPARKQRGTPSPDRLFFGVWHDVTPWHARPGSPDDRPW